MAGGHRGPPLHRYQSNKRCMTEVVKVVSVVTVVGLLPTTMTT